MKIALHKVSQEITFKNAHAKTSSDFFRVLKDLPEDRKRSNRTEHNNYMYMSVILKK